MRDSVVSERLDKEYTQALLKDYSGTYEEWLEDRVEALEAIGMSIVAAWDKHQGGTFGVSSAGHDAVQELRDQLVAG